ncbi:hypothetical protein SAMN05444266_101138 [Chitinophaga jiangningensis]|uniref:Uncharacterized protein n=1 Tax=Chitinophaga jiangningensis TaxID=1419482 RepID=A0A1M6VAZ1_9BACT|nr:hypothetical protein [Chitinophaga jiangningensis]SHK78628.1 hypothetical protein SAMN05444266_101138 [Chitinophaga jiangningensis]
MNFRKFAGSIVAAIVVLLTMSLSANAQVTGSFNVHGDFDKFYPVQFNDCNWDANKSTLLEIGRSSAHLNGDWHGSLMAKFRYHVTKWGHGSNFIDAEINQENYSAAKPFVAGYEDCSGTSNNAVIVIWLRGNSTYYFSATCEVTPQVYDGIQNLLPYQITGAGTLTFKTEKDAYVQSSGSTNSRPFSIMNIAPSLMMGPLSIGTMDIKGYMLAVNGNAVFAKVTVKNPANWPDYVFASDYSLLSLQELDNFIQEHKHLPGISTAAEIKTNGQDVADIQVIQQQKIEELTLYLIKLSKELEEQREKIKTLEKKLNQ